MTDQKFSYDEVPYSSFTFPQTRPDRLATLAAIYGLQPADPENCRVLELGCGDGTNLLSFAYILPDSRFVGIDLAKGHIDRAKAAADELQLSNVEFHCEDVTKVDCQELGKFDFIIAHGLFSWVPEHVRTRILEIYELCLKPEGVGCLSYNVYPGCKTREIVWDMMKFYTAELADPMERVAAGIQFLNFINFAADQESTYRRVIATELCQYSQRTPENIFHDDLSNLNRPFYFREFTGLLEPHGLQYLCEVDAFWNESRLRPEIEAKLDELGDDVLKREQFIDYILGRPFRTSVIVREAASIDRAPSPDILKNFYLASQAEPSAEVRELASNAAVTFKGLDGVEASASHPLAKAAVIELSSQWSNSVKFDDLIRKAADATRLSVDEAEPQAMNELFELFKAGIIYLHRFRPEFPTEASEKPIASRFVRWQLQKKCKDITALSGMNLRPSDDLMRLLLLLCDGTRDWDDLVAEAAARIGFPPEKKEAMLEQLPAVIESRLVEFARLGLLEA
ncbi:MAG: methyltransferase domain-containing protein [Chloracidobacterium sp.]|nr:methyltransferase domain-containing protein [Chloracidobacterium sp.]